MRRKPLGFTAKTLRQWSANLFQQPQGRNGGPRSCTVSASTDSTSLGVARAPFIGRVDMKTYIPIAVSTKCKANPADGPWRIATSLSRALIAWWSSLFPGAKRCSGDGTASLRMRSYLCRFSDGLRFRRVPTHPASPKCQEPSAQQSDRAELNQRGGNPAQDRNHAERSDSADKQHPSATHHGQQHQR